MKHVPKPFSIAILLLIFSLTSATAQTGTVKGTVVRTENFQPEPKVKVTAKDKRYGKSGEPSFSIDDGSFTLVGQPIGELEVTAYKKDPTTLDRYFGHASAIGKNNGEDTTDPEAIRLAKNTASLRPDFPNRPASEVTVALARISVRELRESGLRLVSPLKWEVAQAEASATQDQSAAGRPKELLDTVSGTVVNEQQVPIANVRIVIQKADSGELLDQEPKKTDENGHYSLTLPEPGDYILSIMMDGYHSVELLIIKDAGKKVTLFDDKGKPVAAVDHQIQLEAEAGDRGPESAHRGGSTEAARRYFFFSSFIQALPLSGIRRLDTLVLLVPGVSPAPATTGGAGPGINSGIGSSGQFAVNGLRSRENNFTMDGSDNNEEDVGVRRQGYVALSPQPIESIEEFQVITALADARFGRNVGGQIHALTRYGGRGYHGMLYDFFTDSRLQGQSPFDLTTNQYPASAQSEVPITADGLLGGPPVRFHTGQGDSRIRVRDGYGFVANPVGGVNPFTRSQAGFTLGGPVTQHKSFFFVSFEKQAINASRESHFAVPTVQQRGVFDSGATGIKRASDGLPLYPASIPGDAIFSLYPFPNDPLGAYGPNTYTAILPASGQSKLAAVKMDRELDFLGKHHTLTGRYGITDESSIVPVTGGAIYSSLRPRMRLQNFALFFNTTLSSADSNTLRLSYGRTGSHFDEVRDPALPPSALFPNEPFLLNAPLLLNQTLPNANATANSPIYVSASTAKGQHQLSALGYNAVTQTEQITGPLGQVVIAGFSPVGVDVFNYPQARFNNTIQIADTLTMVRGTNTVNMLITGFDIRRTQVNSVLERNYRPLAVFNGLVVDSGELAVSGVPQSQHAPPVIPATTLAAMGVPTALSQTFASIPNASLGLRLMQSNLFFQDEIRIKPNFYITLGFRYEINRVPKTDSGRLEKTFDRQDLERLAKEAIGGSDVCVKRCVTLVDSLVSAFSANFKVSFGSDLTDYNPRIGFAWAPWKDYHLSVRGGFGVYTGQFLGFVLNQSRNPFPDFAPINLANFSPRSNKQSFLFNLSNPAVQSLLSPTPILAANSLNQLATGVNPVSLLGRLLFNLDTLSLSATNPGLDLVLPQSELKTPYAMHFVFTLEYEFTPDILGSISYVGTRGLKLLRVATPNQGTYRNGIRFDRPDSVSQLGNSNFPFFQGSLSTPQKPVIGLFTIARSFFESSAQSSYQSLQVEVNKRFSRGSGFLFGLAFTYSHVIDDASDFLDNAGAFALPQDSQQRSERASANFDVRFRTALHFIWDIPFFKANRWLKTLQIAGILTTQSGQPFTVNSATDVNQDGNLTDRLNTTSGLISDAMPDDGRTQLQLAPGVSPMSLLATPGMSGAIGRNTFRSPRIIALDVAVTKTIKIKDQVKLALRLEAFNLLDRTNFGTPVRILESPAFGKAVSTISPERTVQVALKLSF